MDELADIALFFEAGQGLPDGRLGLQVEKLF